MLESFLAECPARRRPRKRRAHLRLRHRALLRLRRRQVRAASLVGGAQCRPPRDRRRTEAAPAPHSACCASASRNPRCWRFAPIAISALRQRIRAIREPVPAGLRARAAARNFPATSSTPSAAAPTWSTPAARFTLADLLRQGQSAFAVLGVNARRDPALHRCRSHFRHSLDGSPARAACRSRPCRRTQALPARGPKRDGPPAHGASQSRRRQVAALRIRRARGRPALPVDCDDSGNIVTRLVRAVDAAAARARFAASIARMQSIVPECETYVESPRRSSSVCTGSNSPAPAWPRSQAHSATTRQSPSDSGPPSTPSTMSNATAFQRSGHPPRAAPPCPRRPRRSDLSASVPSAGWNR